MTETKELDFKPYTAEAWIVFVAKDEKSWWCERLIGFVEVEEIGNGYCDKITFWDASYLEEGCVVRVGENRNCQVIFNRKPTYADAKKVKENDLIDVFCGTFEEGLKCKNQN